MRWYWHLLASATAGSGLTLALFGTPRATVQKPAVAGSFYAADPKVLSADLDALLKQVEAQPIRNPRALICPHAGYSFSGPTAAHGYRQLVGRDFSTVIVMGPSHYAAFQGSG